MEIIENIQRLLLDNKITATKMLSELNLAKNAMSEWKKGRIKPSIETMQKIATYFNVSVDYLLTGKETDYNEELGLDNETLDYLEELKNRPEMKMLFSVSKGATKEDIEKTVKIIEALRGNE